MEIAPVFDEVLQENIAWRIWNLDHKFTFIANGTVNSLKIPIFVLKKYTRWSENWDHDHCCGCGVKFMENGTNGALSEGWETFVGPASDRWSEWLCGDCHRIIQEIGTGRLEFAVEGN